MTLENYRSSLDYREILRILQKASNLQENFLWQSSPAGKTIIQVHHFEIDFVAREVVVYFDSKENVIDEARPLYVKLDYRTSVFKVTEFHKAQNTIHFAFPNEIKTQEYRVNPRHQFLPEKLQTVSLKPSMGKKDTGTEINVRVLDISKYGLGLIVSEQNRPFLKNNRILWVTQLGSERLDYPVLAEVVYMNSEVDSKFSTKKQKEMKVGLKLSGLFSNDIYQKFIQ